MTSVHLEDQLCFAVYSAEHAFSRAYKPLLDKIGITYPQLLVLMVLWRQDDQTVTDLGEKLLLDSSTLTPLLKRMERQGLVSRVRQQDDERHVRIRLTPAGQQLAEPARSIRTCVMATTGLQTHELARLKQAIDAVRDRLVAERERA